MGGVGCLVVRMGRCDEGDLVWCAFGGWGVLTELGALSASVLAKMSLLDRNVTSMRRGTSRGI